MVSQLVVLQMHMHNPLFGLQMCIFFLKLPQGLYYVSVTSKGSGKTALMHRLVSAFPGRLCTKYPFLIC